MSVIFAASKAEPVAKIEVVDAELKWLVNRFEFGNKTYAVKSGHYKSDSVLLVVEIRRKREFFQRKLAAVDAGASHDTA